MNTLTAAEMQLVLKILDEQLEEAKEKARHAPPALLDGYIDRITDLEQLITKLETLWHITDRWN